MTDSVAMPAAARGLAHVLFVAALLQCGFIGLAGLGEFVVMGANPLYLLMPALRIVLLAMAGAAASRGRRWGVVTLLVIESVSLLSVLVNGVLGALPWLDYTVNLVGILTNMALPAAMAVLAARMLRAGYAPRRRRGSAPTPAAAGLATVPTSAAPSAAALTARTAAAPSIGVRR